MVGSGTDLNLMGDTVGMEREGISPTSTNANKKDHQHSFALGKGSPRPFPVHHRESASITGITDMMYLQQRKCENCSSGMVPLTRSNW